MSTSGIEAMMSVAPRVGRGSLARHEFLDAVGLGRDERGAFRREEEPRERRGEEGGGHHREGYSTEEPRIKDAARKPHLGEPRDDTAEVRRSRLEAGVRKPR